jgi:hypothetical protein
MIESPVSTMDSGYRVAAESVAAAATGSEGSEVPLEQLESQICELAGHLAAATSRFLVLIGDFDARRGWASWDLPSCSAWLAWKCQVAPGTAREHVRVARALRILPVIANEFAAGRMSYAKIRALTRVATAQTEADLAELAGPMTAAQLERFVAAHRRVSRADDQHSSPARRLSYRVEDDGSLVLSVRLPGTHVGAEALTSADRSEGEPRPDPAPTGHPAHPLRCHLEDGPAISRATAQRIACHATVSWMLHDHKGNVLDVGRRHRRPPPALRRAVRERDRYRCRAPGCQSRRTDIHHIRPWAKGGKTRLRDLILLGEAHHMIVHAAGYIITLTDDGTFIFAKPDGTVVPNCPRLPEAEGDISCQHTTDITADTIIPAGLGDKLDLDFTIWACFANARIPEERRHAGERELAA